MEDNNQDRLELAMEANFKKALLEVNQIKNSLNATNTAIKSVKVNLDKLGNTKSFSVTTKEIKETKNETEKLNSSLNKTKKLLNVGFKLGSLYALWNLTKRIRQTIIGWIQSSVDFIEVTNKFEVAMGSMSDKAYNFQTRLSQAFGTVTKEMMNYQATFKNIMASLPGLTADAEEQVSETLVKLGLDYSSLYNVEQQTAMSRIQAALVGSVKPIRSDTGYDITEATIGMKANELGIETSVRNLNQMEKRLLRIIVLMDQMRNTGAMQDLARTIEQPANQIKVLKNQVQELGVWLGNVFIGTIGKILPYINGFVMALVEIAKTLAIFVGYTNTGSGLAEGLEVAEDASEGIASGIGGAASSAKELKKTLMGFDVLNVIQKSSSSGGGGGGGGSSLGGVNPAILNALKDYDNLMDKVKMKATEIRDNIMEWLGFTKEINPETGEITWKLKDGYTNLEKIIDIIKAIAITWLGSKILGTIGNIITGLGAGGVLGAVNKLKVAIALMAGSWYLAKDAANDYVESLNLREKEGDTKEAIDLSNMGFLKSGASVLSGTLAGTLIGATLGGPIGAVIGTGVGGMISIANSYNENLKAYNEKFKKDFEKDYEMYKRSARDAVYQDELARSNPEYKKHMEEAGLSYGTVRYIEGTENLAASFNNEFFEAGNRLIELRRTAYAEVVLFENAGESIDVFYQKYKQAIDEITRSADIWLALYNNYTMNNDALKASSDTLDVFIAKLSSNAYQVTADDIANINNILNQMTGYVEASGEAFVTATASSMDSLVQEGYISRETADLVVESAMRKAQAEGDATKAYELALQDLNLQLQRGTITQDEYNEKAKELEQTWKDQMGYASDTTQSIKNLKSTLQTTINMKSWDTAAEYIEQFGTTLDEAKEKERQLRDERINNIDITINALEKEIARLEKNGETESEEYLKSKKALEEATKAKEGILQQYEDNVSALDQATYDSLTAILHNLHEAGLDMENDSYGIYKMIQEQLDKIGKDTKAPENLEGTFTSIRGVTSKARDDLNTLLSGIQKNFDGTFSFKFDAKADYSTLLTKLKQIKTRLENMASNSLIAPMFTNIKIAINGLIDKISSFATGGFPEMGELFVAREAGPELVGSIGSRNAVMNNQQIVEAVSSGVANAVSSVLGNGGSSYQLIIDGEQITNVVQKRLTRRANITGMAMGV